MVRIRGGVCQEKSETERVGKAISSIPPKFVGAHIF